MPAELIILNARIRSMDPARPLAEAIAVTAGKIAALGSTAHIRTRAGPASRIIDAGGRLVLPGFQDAHVHLLSGGTDLVETAQLFDATSVSDLQNRLRIHADRHAGPMIWGAGWKAGFFGDHNLNRCVLDAVVPDRPCLIYDDSAHNACLNSRACDLVGITAATPDPPNGHLVRDLDGVATGMLHEEAINWALGFLPATGDETYAQGLLAGQSHANRHGITGVIDPSILPFHARTYAKAAADGALTLRVAGACLITGADTVDTALARLRALRAANSGRYFQLNAAKFFLDGVFENRTAALLEPYADARGGNAGLMFGQDQINALFTALDADRFQIHVHCIGDAASRAALDGFEAARRTNGVWPSLHQIAHVQLLHPDDLPRFAELGVMANIQPFWAAHDPIIPDDTLAMVGALRARNSYAFRALINAGARYCIGSDWTVSTLNPFEIIGTAVTREPPRARGRAAPFFADQCLTVEECVLGYTSHAAAACWRDDISGTLRPGLSGDLIILERDIFTCDRHAIAETKVLSTIFAGREVYRDPDFAG